MKIFYCITKSEMGGAQTYLWRLLEHAKKNGDTAIVMSNGEGWLFDRARELGFDCISNPYFKNSFNPLNLVRAVLETRKAIKKFSPDVVHCNSSSAGLFGRIAAYALHARIIFTAHGWGFTEGTPIIRRTIVQITETLIAPITDMILCVSHNDARLAKKYLFGVKNKIQVIHNGVPIPEVFATPGISETIHILFAGRLTAPKLPITIIEALGQLSDDYKKIFNIHIAGHGEQESLLRESIQKNNLENQVTIQAIPTQQMSEYYQKSDLFILPTQWEGFPMTIVEALSFGVPVVASAVGGIPEAVDDGVGKLLNKGHEVSELKTLFEMIVRDKHWLITRGVHARDKAKQEFSVTAMCEKTWKNYEYKS